jgi:hypothetical protein
MRDLFTCASVLVTVFAAACLVIVSAPGFWLRLALATYMVGRATITAALWPPFADGRSVLGFSRALAFRVMFGAYLVAGVIAILGAFMHLHIVLACVVSFLLLVGVGLGSHGASGLAGAVAAMPEAGAQSKPLSAPSAESGLLGGDFWGCRF